MPLKRLIHSVPVRAGIAFIVSLFAPLLIYPLMPHDPYMSWMSYTRWDMFPGILFILSAIFIGVLSLTLPWHSYSDFSKSWIHTLPPTVLIAGSLYGSFWCFQTHVCMAGHGCHGMTPLGRVVDAMWIFGLMFGSTWAAATRSPLSVSLAFISGFVISFRFQFGSLGGIYPWL